MLKIYRQINETTEQIVETVSTRSARHISEIMGAMEVQVNVVTERVLNTEVGDYVVVDNVRYTLNRDAEYQKISDIQHAYSFVFEHPLYTLLDKLFIFAPHGVDIETMTAISTLIGTAEDFIGHIVWNLNKTDENPLGVDTGWKIGTVCETIEGYKNITFDSISCRDMLTLVCEAFNVEFYLENKTIHLVRRIENPTGLIFEQGRRKGLYTVSQLHVDRGDRVTRIYPLGGTQNVPNKNANPNGNLKLPEIFLNASDAVADFDGSNRIVERKVVFDDIFPHLIGEVTEVIRTPNGFFDIRAKQRTHDDQLVPIDFVLRAVGDNARINFLTGHLMGVSFEFNHDGNETTPPTLFKIVEQEDATALPDDDGNRVGIPSDRRPIRVGDLFNFTGIIMPPEYVDKAIDELRAKAIDWLEFYSRKRVKFELDIDNRFMRGKQKLKVGDLVRILIPEKRTERLIRVTKIDEDLHTGAMRATVSNFLDEKWRQKIEGQISQLQSTIHSGFGRGGNVDIIEEFDDRTWNDRRVLSSLRTRRDFISSQPTETMHQAQGRVNFHNGLEMHSFNQGGFMGTGAGFYRELGTNHSVLEVDKMIVRREAQFNELVINQIRFQGGIVVFSAASLEVSRVENAGSVILAYFDARGGSVQNHFAIDDIIRCQRFEKGNAKYYMGRVIDVSTAPNGDGEHRILISTNPLDISGTLNVEVGDVIVQFGNFSNERRQSLVEIDVLDGGRQIFYQNVNSFDLTDKNAIDLGMVLENGEWKNVLRAYGNLFIGDREESNFIRYNEATRRLEIRANVEFQAPDESWHNLNDMEIGGENLVQVENSDSFSFWGNHLFDVTIAENISSRARYVFSFESMFVESMFGNNELVLNVWANGGHLLSIELLQDKNIYGIDLTEVSENFNNFRFAISAPGQYITFTKISLQRGNKPTTYVQALRYLSDAIQNGSTQIHGGLINTNMMLLQEASTGEQTAGISGLRHNSQTNENDLPAVWAGGDYEKALNLIDFLDNGIENVSYSDLAKIALMHNGAGKIGDFVVEAGGRIVMFEPNTGRERLAFRSERLPSIRSLMGYYLPRGTADNEVRFLPIGNTILPNTIEVTENGSSITFRASNLRLFGASANNSTPSAEFQVFLLRYGEVYDRLAFGRLNVAIGGQGEANFEIDQTRENIPAGVYSIRIEITARNLHATTFRISASTLSWEFQRENIRRFEFGTNGMMGFFADNHIYFTEDDGLDVRGKVNLSGLSIGEDGILTINNAIIRMPNLPTTGIGQPSGTLWRDAGNALRIVP